MGALDTRIRRPFACAGLAVLAFVLAAGYVSMGAEAQAGTPTAEATGQLLIRGEAVEGIVLEKRNMDGSVDDRDRPVRLDRPEPSVTLPAGRYRVQEVRLRGGYRCHPPGLIVDLGADTPREVGWFVIGPDQPHELHLGAPLKPVLKVIRENRDVRMSYVLADVSGGEFWHYASSDFGCGPVAEFSVYRGGERVGGGVLGPFG